MKNQHQFDVEKLKTLVLYVCSKCEPTQLGAIKLHKTLYFSDMLFYAENGHPITGAIYRKRPLGPTCDAILPIIRDLERDGDLEVTTVNYHGYHKKQFICKNIPDMTRINDKEKLVVDEMIDFVCKNNTAKMISDLSHNRAWDHADFGDVITYSSVFKIFPNPVSLEALDWASNEVKQIAAKPTSESVVRKPLSDLRASLYKESRA